MVTGDNPVQGAVYVEPATPPGPANTVYVYPPEPPLAEKTTEPPAFTLVVVGEIWRGSEPTGTTVAVDVYSEPAESVTRIESVPVAPGAE
jgi:hypothetical protein